MNLIFKNSRIFQRMHEGPLGSYIDSYAAEMREQGYCAAAMESHRFVWLLTLAVG